MPDPEKTLEPHQPITGRSIITRLMTWSETHTAVSIPIAAFVAGFVLAKIL